MIPIRFPTHPVLIVDDEIEVLRITEAILSSGGMNNLRCCQDSRDVMDTLTREEIGVMLLDLRMPHISG